MLTLIGLLIIIVIVTLLMTGKANPIVAMAIVPFIGALIAGCSIAEISDYFKAGLLKVSEVAAMFLFAILFFSILKELRVFDPLIQFMLKFTRGNVIIVAMMTSLIAAIVHLDGSGAATFLIIIPALLPLYRQLGMSPYLMMLLMAGSMGVMNMVPWGGPLGRSAAVTGIDTATLWHSLIPVQLIGVGIMVIFAALMGMRENRRIAAAQLLGTTPFEQDCQAKDLAADHSAVTGSAVTEKVKIRNLYVNLLLVVASITCLAFGLFPAPYVFMIALSLLLLLNFRSPKQQMEAISRHAPQALSMVAIILAAGAFLGILSESGMLKSIASDLIYILPSTWVNKLHVMVGILGVPLDLFTSTDAYYFALLPVIQEATATVGVPVESVVYAMAIGNNAGTFVSPFSPATWLAVGLAGIDMGRHLRYSFGWIWLLSFFFLLTGYFLNLY